MQCHWYKYSCNITSKIVVFWPFVFIRITYYPPTNQQSNAVRYVSCRPGQEKSRITDLGVYWEILTRVVHMDSTIRTQRTTRARKMLCLKVYVD